MTSPTLDLSRVILAMNRPQDDAKTAITLITPFLPQLEGTDIHVHMGYLQEIVDDEATAERELDDDLLTTIEDICEIFKMRNLNVYLGPQDDF